MRLPFDIMTKRQWEALTSTRYPVYDDSAGVEDEEYIVVGEMKAADIGAKNLPFFAIETTIEVYSDRRGMRGVNDMVNAVLDALMPDTFFDITEEGFSITGQSFREAEVLREFDGEQAWRHGTVRVLYEVVEGI